MNAYAMLLMVLNTMWGYIRSTFIKLRAENVTPPVGAVLYYVIACGCIPIALGCI